MNEKCKIGECVWYDVPEKIIYPEGRKWQYCDKCGARRRLVKDGSGAWVVERVRLFVGASEK